MRVENPIKIQDAVGKTIAYVDMDATDLVLVYTDKTASYITASEDSFYEMPYICVESFGMPVVEMFAKHGLITDMDATEVVEKRAAQKRRWEEKNEKMEREEYERLKTKFEGGR